MADKVPATIVAAVTAAEMADAVAEARTAIPTPIVAYAITFFN
jgi:hypothetical protein